MLGFAPVLCVGFDEAAGGQCAQGDEGAEVRELLRPKDRRRRQHEHLPVPGVLRHSSPHLFSSSREDDSSFVSD